MSKQDKPQLLVIAENQYSLLAVLTTLEQNAYGVTVATCARDALQYLLVRDFSVVILDTHLSDIDGYEIASLLRSREKSKNIPLIFLSNWHSEKKQTAKNYLKNGVDYLYRPFEPEVIREKINHAIDYYNRSSVPGKMQSSLTNFLDSDSTPVATHSNSFN